jgi:hypothetical protein
MTEDTLNTRPEVAKKNPLTQVLHNNYNCTVLFLSFLGLTMQFQHMNLS